MPRGLDGADLRRVFRILHLLCRGARIDYALHHSVLDQCTRCRLHAFTVERRACLQRMLSRRKC